jgi:hypothetical protein
MEPEGGPESAPPAEQSPPKRARPIFDPRSWPFDRLVALVASIGALAAMGASVRSCQVSEQQAQIAERSFVRGQQVMLAASFEPGHIRLKAVEANHLLQAGHVSLPSAFSLREHAIGPGGTIAYEYGLAFDVSQYLLGHVDLEQGLVASGEISLPVMIFSYYTVSGEPRDDLSVYWLTFQFRASAERGVFELVPSGMIFATRLAENVAQNGEEVFELYRQDLDTIFENDGLELKVSFLGAPLVRAAPE